MITSPIKLNVIYSRAPSGSESKPEERGTSDEGASDEVRADLLDTRTVQVVKNTDQRDFYRNIIGLNRSLLRLTVQSKRSDRGRSPCAASGLGFDFADGSAFVRRKPNPFVIITTTTKLTPHPLRSR